MRVRDSKGSALHSVDEELGSWRFALANLFTLSEMRLPTQVNTSSLSLSCKIKFNCVFQPWRLTCSGSESTITIGLELFCVAEKDLEEGMKPPTQDGVQECAADDFEDVDVGDGSGSSQEEPVVQQRRGKRQSLRKLFMKSTPLFNKSQSD